MIVLFKFEEEFYRRHGINADFTGHPLLDTVRPSTEKDEFLAEMGLDKSKTAIPLLPGSRSSEIKHILPVMLKACQMIKKALPAAQFIIAKSPQVDLSFYSRTVKKYNLNLKIAEGRAYDCLNCADFSFVASGTATLESAIIGKPFLVIYKMGILNYLLYRPQVKVPFIGMANIVCGEKIVPEFIQFRARPRMIAEYVLKFLNDPRQQERQKEGFARLRQLLNPPGGYRRAAEAIMELISKK
jgi:lipid-A-disaccharide synthase